MVGRKRRRAYPPFREEVLLEVANRWNAQESYCRLTSKSYTCWEDITDIRAKWGAFSIGGLGLP